MQQATSTATIDSTPLTFSEILPVFPPKGSVFASNLLWPGLLTALVTGLLWLPFVQNNAEIYFKIIAYYIVLMTLLIFYLNAGPNKRLGPTVFAAILTALILWVPYLTRPYFYFFRELPSLHEPTTKNFFDRFSYYFVIAGLMEELIKATPALILLAMTPILGVGRNRYLGRLGIHAPIDGVLMGIASGGAFTLIEILEQYVPRLMNDIATELSKLTVSPDQTYIFHQMAELTTFSLGFLLLMPRILGALIGHMSYAVVFGYFIGLAAFHRASILVLLAIGWLAAATMHGIWDASGDINQTLYIGVASFLISFAYFIKARAMSQNLA